jgi:hypothetical protein
MTIPSTNISMSAIRTELGSSSGSLKALSELAGKSAPHGMNEFANYTYSLSMSVTSSGSTRYFGKGARMVRGVLADQPTTVYFDGSEFGSITSGNPMSSSGWGTSLTVVVAMMLRTNSTSLSGIHFEATSTSSTVPNMTWWNTLTISKSGYTSLVYNRSNVSNNSWDSTQKRMFIRWSPPVSTVDSYYDICSQTGTTWTFST